VAVAVTLSDGGRLFSDGGVIVVEGPPGPPSALDALVGDAGSQFVATGTGDGNYCIVGQILLFPYVPSSASSMVPCDGRTLAISSNTALFALIGTHFGGDGLTTFGLPDLRALAPNQMTYAICAYGVFP
jgi:hypothetical protein